MEYRPGVQHSNADVLSRLALPEAISEVPGETILLMGTYTYHLLLLDKSDNGRVEIRYFHTSEDLYNLDEKLLLISLSHFNNRRKN